MTHQGILDNVPVESETHGTLDTCFFREFKGEMFLFLEYYKPESEVFEVLVYCLDEDFVMGGAADAGCEIKPGGTLDQEPYGYLRDLFVRHRFQRRGIATFLIERLTRYANRQGYLSIRGSMPRENFLQDITPEDRAKFYSSVGCEVDLVLATFRLEVTKTIPERE